MNQPDKPGRVSLKDLETAVNHAVDQALAKHGKHGHAPAGHSGAPSTGAPLSDRAILMGRWLELGLLQGADPIKVAQEITTQVQSHVAGNLTAVAQHDAAPATGAPAAGAAAVVQRPGHVLLGFRID